MSKKLPKITKRLPPRRRARIRVATKRVAAAGCKALGESEQLLFRERIRHLQERARAYPPTGLEADKAFYDELSGDI